MDGKFNMNVELSRVDKAELMSVKNLQYNKLLNKYNHLKGPKLEGRGTSSEIPIQVVLGARDYAMVKTTTAQKVKITRTANRRKNTPWMDSHVSWQ